MNGIGAPKSQAQAAALLGAWEGVGFLTKEGKGKTASYKIVDGYKAGNWPGATNEQRKQCYQRILRNIPLSINLNAVKIRAVCLKKITYEAADFTL
ncbi:hypothetical protein JKP25_18460 [Vibrio vulnificus]|nr:hypothetical protein HW45_28565 [Vibrio sp. ER1A]MCA3970754.1 hypothetical protein [Vibrio vulnificus]